jgi:hypothetical protein
LYFWEFCLSIGALKLIEIDLQVRETRFSEKGKR